MNSGGDAADQVVRYSLEGTEVALRLTGSAAKNFAVFVAAVLKDQKKTHGKTHLTRLLREGKPLKFFEIPADRMKEFTTQAKLRGLLFVPIKDKDNLLHVEIAVQEDDAAKVNRVLDRMGLDAVMAAAGDAVVDVQDDRQEDKAAPATETVETEVGEVTFETEDEFDMGFPVAGDSPAKAETIENGNPSGNSLPGKENGQLPSADERRARGEKPSVRQELQEIRKAQRAERKEPPRQREARRQRDRKPQKRQRRPRAKAR